MALPLFAVLDAKRGLLDATLVSPRFRCIIPDDPKHIPPAIPIFLQSQKRTSFK